MKSTWVLFILGFSILGSYSKADNLGGRLEHLLPYSRTLPKSDDSKIKGWINAETLVYFHADERRKVALAQLDSVTNQLSGRNDGIEWASELRMRLLRVIERMNYGWQLEIFPKVLEIALEGFDPRMAIRKELLVIEPLENNLNDTEFAKARIANRVTDVSKGIVSFRSEDEAREFLSKKSLELEEIQKNGFDFSTYSPSFNGFCQRKFRELRSSMWPLFRPR